MSISELTFCPGHVARHDLTRDMPNRCINFVWMSMNIPETYANQFTKEAIKARMMRHAAELWGAGEAHLLDPFVRLLMEAFSTEVHRASNETQNIESRLLDKLARLLTPDLLTSARPAHAILQALPVQRNLRMHPHTRFTLLKTVQRNHTDQIRKTEIQLNFSPTRSWRLIRGRVAVMANGYQVKGIDQTGFKQLLSRTETALPAGSCWLGLQLDEGITDLSGVGLYFDFSLHETSPWVYQLLPRIQLFYNGRPVDIYPGMTPDDQGAETDNIFSDYELLRKLHEDIEQHYMHKFVSIGACPLGQRSGSLPAALEEQLDTATASRLLKEKLCWLELRFPVNYSYELLNHCSISINSFPVSNRSLRKHIYSYKGLNSILPLRTDEYERLLAVHKVSDSASRIYREVPDNSPAGHRNGYYTVRYGGVERFDQRSAHDMVNYLLELSRDEVAAFSSLDQSFIRTALEDLARQIRRIHTKARQLDKYLHQSPGYIVLEPVDPEENIQVEYWVTQGDEANGLRSGTPLSCPNNPEIEVNGSRLVSRSSGGRPPLQAGERQELFKYALTGRDRLVTREDIQNYCRAALGPELKAIRFKRGIVQSAHPKQGYIRSLEIHLTPALGSRRDRDEWAHMSATLLQKIIRLSPEGTQYSMHLADPV